MKTEDFSQAFKRLYPDSEIENQTKRYSDLISQFEAKFDKEPTHLFSTPGRTEISGNHTDHNNGKVLAASINLDTIAAVSMNNADEIRVISEGYKDPIFVDLDSLTKDPNEVGTTAALIKGIVSKLLSLNYQVHGFDCYIKTDVLIGSGLSSSASFELLIGTIISSLYNHTKIANTVLAKAGQYAENVFFGKPCGLMDQLACAMGKIISIDFEDPLTPVIEPVSYDFTEKGYGMLIVDTGGDHADLTPEYASIPTEMKKVADYFYNEVCRDITLKDLTENAHKIREKSGDRAILRVLHFLNENKRVDQQIEALKNDDLEGFLENVNASGNSSFKYLQNIYCSCNPERQGIALALALSEQFIQEIDKGACRVHGGGFAGTILVFLPLDSIENYKKLMEPIFGKNSVKQLFIRNIGTVCLNRLIK